jgi:hypothetical protein
LDANLGPRHKNIPAKYTENLHDPDSQPERQTLICNIPLMPIQRPIEPD